MKNLRPLLLALAATAALTFTAAAPAQHAHHGGFMRMVRSLGLSDAQRTQFTQILQQYRAQHPKGSSPDPQARKAMRKQLLGVLTPQQRDQLRSEIKARREQRQERLGASPSPTPEETAQP